MIESNLRLVVYAAKRVRHRDVPFSDVVHEDVVGLIKAVDKFDRRRGVRFATYALWWIDDSCRRAARKQRALAQVFDDHLGPAEEVPSSQFAGDAIRLARSALVRPAVRRLPRQGGARVLQLRFGFEG